MHRMLISQVLCHQQQQPDKRVVLKLSNHLFNQRIQLAKKQENLTINLCV